MSTQWWINTLINLGVNLAYTLIALVLGVLALLWIDKVLLKRLDIEDELSKGNIAVAIFASTVLLFVAIIVAAAIST